MVKASRKEDFEYIMAKVGKIDHKMKDYLYNAEYDKWTRCHTLTNRGRMMTLNIDECVNDCLVDVCELPILEFL